MLDFATLRLKPTPNQCLAAPAGITPQAQPHLAAPEFPVAAAKLYTATEAAIAAMPRTRILQIDPAQFAFEAEQRSAFFGFRDLISVKVVSLAPKRASLALYSRSLVGYSDLGVNASRVKAILAAIPAQLVK